MPLRKYPAPPTAHELMAMFPPAPPNNFDIRPGSTSDFFRPQERAFFAQAGKEIIRVTHGSELDVRQQRPTSRPWALNGPGSGPGPLSSSPTPPHHSPGQSPSAPLLYPHPATRPVPVNPPPMFPSPPLSSHTPTLASTGNQIPSTGVLYPPIPHQTTSGLCTPPEDPTTPPNSSSKYEPDESWRRPMPYAERRRAEKHTRRVIVRT